MEVINKIKIKKSEMGGYINKDELSSTLLFFRDEIVEMFEAKIKRKDIIKILENELEIKINYNSFQSFYTRHISKNLKKELKQEVEKSKKAEEDNSSSTIKKQDIISKEDKDIEEVESKNNSSSNFENLIGK